MTDKIISIIIPVLNAGSHINDCVSSLTNQSFPKDKYEIIIVDNGSKDDTIDRLVQYIGHITILREPKKGSYAARNTGIKIAKGEIIAFTDSDCVADKNWLKELYEGFSSKDIGCVVGAINAYPGKSLVEIYSRNKNILSQKTVLDSRFLPYGQTANTAFRREVFGQIGYFDERLASAGDADISWRMQLNTTYKLVYNPKAIIEHRHRSSFKGLFRQQFRYGFGRIWLYKKYGDHMKSCTDTNYDMRYNLLHSIKLISNIVLFSFRSTKRLFGFCDKYNMYEPLLSILYSSGYVIGKVYGSVKLKKSFFSTL